MTRHPSEESLLAVAEGGGSGADLAHVAACADCAAQVEAARAGLALARRADVPEPSPFYWGAMRRGIGQRIEEDRARARWRTWLAPLAATAAAVVVVALASGRAPAPASSPAPVLSAWAALPPADEDASLEVLEGLAVADAGLEAFDEELGVGSLLADLSEEESRALAESFRAAGKGGES
jgi:anti-sigma factor ChrR (cupin superfamily)